jgi:RNA polymerase-binding transcription factor DksA
LIASSESKREECVVTCRKTTRCLKGSIESGDYGFCARCREPIDLKRLEAVPTTDTCIHCAK